MAVTSAGSSRTETLPLASFVAASMKSFHVFSSRVIFVVS